MIDLQHLRLHGQEGEQLLTGVALPVQNTPATCPVIKPLMAGMAQSSAVEVEVSRKQVEMSDEQVEKVTHRINIGNPAVLIHARLAHISSDKIRQLVKQEVEQGITEKQLKEALTHDCRPTCPACLVLDAVRRPVYSRQLNLPGGPDRPFAKVYEHIGSMSGRIRWFQTYL
jgi:hypothetical protein